jgi:Transposase DDE domain
VRTDLDDLVTALYVTIDDLFGPRRRPGHPPKLSDAELVCLAVAQVLLGARSERHWLRFASRRLGHLFPYLPRQAGYNKRLRAAGHLLAAAIRHLARISPSWWDGLRLLDATPLPCAASRQTVKRSALWPHCAYGYCRAHSRWYWGFKLYLLCTPDGMPVSWCLATPKLGERQVAQALLADLARTDGLAPGTIILADKGFAGRQFHQQVGELGAVLVRPDRKDEPARFGSLGGMRQWVESVFDTLKDQLGLERHGGRTLGGVFVRVAQRLLALAATVGFNWRLDAPDKRSLLAYDH